MSKTKNELKLQKIVEEEATKSAKAESLAFGLSRLIDVERGRDITEAKEAIYTELSKLRSK